jgi:AcrR family transcriptional regulator
MPRERKSPPRIVKSALQCFAERGVAATSIQAVAERAGMSKQALLHHFPSKAHLHEAVYAMLSERLRSELPAAAADLVSRSYDRYRALIQLALQRFNDEPDLARFLVFELLEQPARVIAWLRDEGAPWVGLIHGVVTQQPDEQLDTQAHVAVLGLLMLAQSALVPRADKRWHARVVASTLRVMQLGSNLPTGRAKR